MATTDDMRERLERVEQKVDLFEKKLDQLGTKADLSKFATRADLDSFAEKITSKMDIMLEDAKVSVRNAAEGYGATLGRIERDLGDFRAEWKTKAEDTARVLANHVDRIVTLERVTGVTRDEPS